MKTNADAFVHPTNVELECIYRHKEDMVEMLNFVQLYVADEIRCLKD